MSRPPALLRRAPALLGGFCLLLAPGFSGPAVAQREKPVEIRFAAMALPPGVENLVMVTEETRSDPFAPTVNSLSPPQTAPARGFRLEKEDEARALGRVRLPDEGNDFIVLLVPGVETTFEAVVIAARGDAFRPGDYYLHNVSGLPVLGKVGSEQFVIGSREGRVVRPRGAREDRFYDVTLGIREDGANRVISSSRWPVAGQMRTYVFFFDNSRRGDVDFRAIDEFVPPEKP